MTKNIFIIPLSIVAGLLMWLSFAKAGISDKEFKQIANQDILQIMQSRKSMADIVAYMSSQPYFLNSENEKNKISINREQRLSVWNTYQAFLDHVLLLDSLGQAYSEHYKSGSGDIKKNAFRISFAAFLAQYRYAMDFIMIMEKNQDFHVVLNEPVPEIGLPEDTYSELKYRFLNVIRGAEFARLHMVYKFYGSDPNLKVTKGMEDDIAAIWERGKFSGPAHTLQNGIRILQDYAFTAWFPVQKGVSTYMSKVRVRRGDDFLITQNQIKKIVSELEPGDILLQRREWCLTNIGLPGFWTHAALYIGRPEERKRFFNDPEVVTWVKTQDPNADTFEALLKKQYSQVYAVCLHPKEKNHPVRVIEAVGEGVVFTTLEHSADADSMVVLRPRLSKQAKARAIYRAFHFYGRPYDYNFDFLTDASLVCSEVVYKAYLPTDAIKGLHLPLSNMLGRTVLSPNNIARMFDEEYDKISQLEFILFLDGNEKENQANRASVNVFRNSWKRPKWHIMVKDTMFDRSE